MRLARFVHSTDIMLARRRSPASSLTIFWMEIIHSTGVEGARQARGIAVVIDVLRSFTVSAYAMHGGARECRLVTTTDEARALAASILGSVLCAEENAMPLPGVPISNSPTQIVKADLWGRVLVQRSTAGTPVAAAVKEGVDIFAASLVVARATVQACLSRSPSTITLIASADHPEDHACARYMEAIVRGDEPHLEQWLEPLRDSERYRQVISGAWPGFPPTDMALAFQTDCFDFSMPVTRQEGFLRLSRGGLDSASD